MKVKQTKLNYANYEDVVEFHDAESGLHCITAIHSTALGPGFGGIRMRPYDSRDAAIKDVLDLAKAMSYKSAIVQAGLGGAKCVVLGDPAMPKEKKHKLLLALAEMLNAFQGRFIGAGDMGLDPTEISIIGAQTPFVAGTAGEKSSGDPSPFTAFGVFQSMRAVAQTLWNDPSIKGRTIAVQGIGKVSLHLIDRLFWEGANIIIGTRDEKSAAGLANKYQAKITSSEEVLKAKCDILAPCAIGGILNAKSLPDLHCQAIVGAANNQLSSPDIAFQLKEKGILYVPDFVVNAGGIINIAEEVIHKYHALEAQKKTENLFSIVLQICRRALVENKTPVEIALEIAEKNLQASWLIERSRKGHEGR